jgi:hypothetical protein
LALALSIVSSAAARASAQALPEENPAETARFHLGPLRFTPSLTVSNLGVDTNVFNEAVHPKQDTVGAVGPAADVWLHLGSSLASGTVSVQYLYFDEYASQRAWNTNNQIKWELPLTRFTPFLEGSYVNSKDRPGYEIDSRARLVSDAFALGTVMRLTPSTQVVVSAKRSRDRFDDGEEYQGINLATTLNRQSDWASLHLRHRLTSLTTFVMRAEEGRDRFDGDTLRDSDSLQIVPGFEMKPSALIAGKVFVGYRSFKPLNPAIAPYRGPVATVDATFTAGATRLGIKVGRDVNYSYQEEQPYYALTDTTLNVTQRITYTWDVTGKVGRQFLDYTPFAPARSLRLTVTTSQADTIREYGGGVGYRFGHMLRLGVDTSYYTRRSNVGPQRDFEGLRIGASVSYGLPQ